MSYIPRNVLTGVVAVLIGVALFGLASGFQSAIGRRGGFDDSQASAAGGGAAVVRDVVPLDQSALIPAGPTDEEIAAEKKAAEEKKLAEDKKKLEAEKAALAATVKAQADAESAPAVLEPPPPPPAPPPPEQPALY